MLVLSCVAVCNGTVLQGQSFAGTYTVNDTVQTIDGCSFSGSGSGLIINATELAFAAAADGSAVIVSVVGSNFTNEAYVQIVGTATNAFLLVLRSCLFNNAYVWASNLTLDGPDVTIALSQNVVQITAAYQGLFMYTYSTTWDANGYFAYFDGLHMLNGARLLVDGTVADVNITTSGASVAGLVRFYPSLLMSNGSMFSISNTQFTGYAPYALFFVSFVAMTAALSQISTFTFEGNTVSIDGASGTAVVVLVGSSCTVSSGSIFSLLGNTFTYTGSSFDQYNAMGAHRRITT